MTFTFIQAMRGLLAVGVMVAHGLIFLGRFGDPQYAQYVPKVLGGIPSMFFAISGFFMAMLVERRSTNFLPQRLLRVYPTFFMILILAYILRGMTTMPLDFKHLYATLPLLPFGGDWDYKLGIEWTLLYEIFYYLVCALFCRPGWYDRFPAFLVIWLLATLGAAHFVPVPWMPNLFNIWLSIWNVSFIGGALLYYYMKTERARTTHYLAAGLTLVTVALMLSLPWQRTNLLLTFDAGAIALLAALVKIEDYLRSPKFFVTLGDNSYALYLVHVTIILFVYDRWTWLTGEKPAVPTLLLAFALCLIACWPLGKMDVALHRRLKKSLGEFVKRNKAAALARKSEAAALAVSRTEPEA